MNAIAALPTLLAALLAAPGTDGDTPIDGFRLRDGRGAWHALDAFASHDAVVLAFLGAECPVADVYASRLAEMARAPGLAGRVGFLGIDPNRQDAPSALVRFAESHKLPFPLLKDVGNRLADRLGVERTPEVVVLDAKRVIRYRGRIDDQFAPGVHRPAASRNDLAIALEEVLAGKPVTVPRTAAPGCRIGREGAPKPDAAVTYGGQVAAILRARCVSCHHEGDIAPFPLTSYEQAAGWAAMIAEVVRDGRMPPWHASPDHGKFANDARLSDHEKRLIAEWADAGAPEGPPIAEVGPPATPEGWRIGTPDLVVAMPKAAEIPAEGTLPYENFSIDPKLDRDVWVKATQVRPGNAAVVHHVVVYALPPGVRHYSEPGADLLAAYAPGMPPRVMPDGAAKLVPKGSRLLLQLHYTPRGSSQADLTRVGLVFADPATVRKQMKAVMAVQTRLNIPAGASEYRASADLRLGQDHVLYALMPHMHLRGKAMRFEATYPDGRKEVLLDVPRYEFDWQNVYVLAEPKALPEGTVIACDALFDNSADNPNNPDPTATVTFGEQTRDEMLVGYMDMALGRQDLSQPAPKASPRPDGRLDVTFRYRPTEPAKSVAIVGTFNDWDKAASPMLGPDADGAFTATVAVKPGRHEYKFVLDGEQYRHDPANPRQAGFFNNSVLDVAKGP